MMAEIGYVICGRCGGRKGYNNNPNNPYFGSRNPNWVKCELCIGTGWLVVYSTKKELEDAREREMEEELKPIERRYH